MSLILTVLSLCALAVAFEQIDIDLFRLQDALKNDGGNYTDFYDWFGVKRNAGHKDIVKAYRKISRKIHPDRNTAPGADEAFARFNQIYKILRSETRERYDYYLSKGFPKYDDATETWYYKRFKPSLLFAFVVLVAICSALEFVMLKTSARRQREYLQTTIDQSRELAAQQSDRGVVTSTTFVELYPGKQVSVHSNGDVYFLGTKIDPSVIEEPTWKDLFICRKILRLKPDTKPEGDVVGNADAAASADASMESEKPEKSEQSAEKETTPELKKGAARRRKAAPRGKARVFT